MKEIKKGIVFSEDILRILKGNNALDFNYVKNNIIIPNEGVIEEVRKDFYKRTSKYFNGEVFIIPEVEMLNDFCTRNDYPVVSLDKVYTQESDNVTFLNATRVDKTTELVARGKDNETNSVDKQVERISKELKEKKQTQIYLADDVIYSGDGAKKIISIFKEKGIEVIGILCSVAASESYEYFNKILPKGIKCNFLLGEDVIDQICERDFYFGIVQSGIFVTGPDGKLYKSPYFKPFGNPIERASIPKEYEIAFSKDCIDRSIAIWEEISKNSGREILIGDLPERITNTSYQDEIVKVLRKERDGLK